MPYKVQKMKLTAAFFMCALFTSMVVAQNTQPLPDAPVYTPSPKPRCDAYTMQTSKSYDLHQKSCFWTSQMFSPTAIFGAAFFGGIAQWQNSPPEWPQGMEGFGRRFGTRYVQGMAKSTGTFLVAAAAHEDLRDQRPPCDGTVYSGWHRFGRTLLGSFYGFKDQTVSASPKTSCRNKLLISRVAGALSSGFVGMAWTPDNSNTVSKALVRSATALGGTVGETVWAEYKGDALKLLTGKK